MSTTYRVDGMKCGGCSASVTKALQALNPQASVTVDLEAKTVTVGGLDDIEAIRGAIEDAGFDFGGKA